MKNRSHALYRHPFARTNREGFRLVWPLIAFLCLACPRDAVAATYYVDFEDGDDNRSGVSPELAFRHAPGDPEAQGNAAITLQPGDVVVFRGGVRYRGSIVLSSSGTAEAPITYRGQGFGDGRAILSGAEPVTGWTLCPSADACGGNPRWAELYCAFAPDGVTAADANLHEDDAFLWLAQDPDMPDPFFPDTASDFYELPEGAVTTTSLVDPDRFNQTDPAHWDGSYLLLWVLPNIVQMRAITSFVPAENRVTFEEVNDPSGYNRYSIYNSPHALDGPGEYWFDDRPETDGTHRICLWPRSATDPNGRIELSVRRFGFDLAGASHAVIEGFIIERYSGSGLTEGLGVGDVSAAYLPNEGIVIRDNVIQHNRHADGGYGGIYLSGCVDCRVEQNRLEENARHAGIFVADGQRVTVSNNTVIRAGATSIRFYGCLSSVAVGNVVTGGHGTHANGMTFYLGCDEVVVAHNRVIDSNIALTLQESSNLTIFGNVFDGSGQVNYVVADWGDLSGNISLVNNTIVGSENHCAVLLDDGPGVVLRNNILDGGGMVTARDHNLYVGLCWNQDENYDWTPEPTEIVAEDGQEVFSDDAYHLAATSPAVDNGANPSALLPSGTGVDFASDIDGERRPQGTGWDIGAYEYPAGGGGDTSDSGCGCQLEGSSSRGTSAHELAFALAMLLFLAIRVARGRAKKRTSADRY